MSISASTWDSVEVNPGIISPSAKPSRGELNFSDLRWTEGFRNVNLSSTIAMSLNTFSPGATSLPLVGLPRLSRKSSVVVVGAGAFGGWTALSLLRQGLRVTLVDGWGAGNHLGSSGDESRILRATYGANEFYFNLCVRALALWKEQEKKWNTQLFFPSSALWLCHHEKTPLLDDSIPFMEKHGMKYDYLTLSQLEKKFPLINPHGLHHAFLDPYAGFLKARESSEAVAKSFVKEGGEFIPAFALSPDVENHRMECINLSNSSSLRADAFVFAMGAWMGKFFPKELGAEIACTKQEVFYFEIPDQHTRTCASMPVWIDADGKDFYYGIPASPSGFKVGVDRRGEEFDPSQVPRTGSPDVLNATRKFLSHRFPELSHVRLVETRVCPYENSPDGNFILKSHPLAENVVFLGGGSGHGFKHGPALGEYVAQALIA